MKFDLSKGLTGLNGEKITADGTTESRQMTMADACAAALLRGADPDDPYTVDETVRRFKLAQLLVGAPGTVDLAAEDVVIIKSALVRMFAPLVAGQVILFLEAGAPAAQRKRR